MSTVAILGSSGFVGSRVCAALEARGATVRAVRAPRLAEGLASAFRRMAAMDPEVRHRMGQRGFDAYRHELSAKAGSQRIEQVLVGAAGGSAQ